VLKEKHEAFILSSAAPAPTPFSISQKSIKKIKCCWSSLIGAAANKK